MKIKTTIALACLAAASVAAAADKMPSASYLCIADMETGFAYDSSSKSWNYARFNTSRWVLRQDQAHPGQWQYEEFRDGDYAWRPCGTFNEYGVMACETFEVFRFDRNTGRFFYAYLPGYTDAGKAGPEGSNTPLMAIGKCSRIF